MFNLKLNQDLLQILQQADQNTSEQELIEAIKNVFCSHVGAIGGDFIEGKIYLELDKVLNVLAASEPEPEKEEV